MEQKEQGPFYIAVEGNIGAGKSTLTRLWARQLGAQAVFENFADNPFLPEFYRNPEKMAFQLEISFLAERFAQLQNAFERAGLFEPHIVSDYLFAKSFVFALNNLGAGEFDLFRKVFDIMNQVLPLPNRMVYIHRDVVYLQANIRKRGRSYEQEIQPGYLQNIQNGYFGYLRTVTQIPVILIDVEDYDFENDAAILNVLSRFVLEREHPAGMHRWQLRELIGS